MIVGDHEGLSYYGDESITNHLNFKSSSDVKSCRKELEKNDLIAYMDGLYQVLGLESNNCYNDIVIKALKHGTTGIGISGNTSETECIGDVINKIFGGV